MHIMSVACFTQMPEIGPGRMREERHAGRRYWSLLGRGKLKHETENWKAFVDVAVPIISHRSLNKRPVLREPCFIHGQYHQEHQEPIKHIFHRYSGNADIEVPGMVVPHHGFIQHTTSE